jgi:DHA1 family tetracycline resistance protein-like MFS transporter
MKARFLAPCWLAIMVDSMGFGLVYPLMTDLFAGEEGLHMASGLSLTLRHFYLGLSFLLYPLAMFFGASLLGDLSDVWGRKKVLLLSMSSLCLSFLLMGMGVTFFSITLLLLGRALSGLMAGSQPIAQAAIADLSTSKTKARNLGLMTLFVSFGIVIGPALGGFFSDAAISRWFTLSTPFYIAAGLALCTALWLAASFKETYDPEQKRRMDWFRPIAIFLDAFRHKQIRFLAIIFILMQMGFSLFYQLIQIFMDQVYDYSSWQLGIFNVYLGISFVIVTLIGIGFFIHYWAIEVVAFSMLILTGLSQILTMLVPTQLYLWIASFFVMGLDMVAYGAMMTIFSNAAGRRHQGWVMGIFNALMALTWAATGFSTNLIQFVGLRLLIIFGGVLLILSGVLMFFFRKHSHARQHVRRI